MDVMCSFEEVLTGKKGASEQLIEAGLKTSETYLSLNERTVLRKHSRQ